MDKLLETIDEIKTLIPDAKYMTLMESLSVLNKQQPTEYKKLLLKGAQFLIEKSRLNKFKYTIQKDFDKTYTLKASFPMPSCVPLEVDLLDEIICRDPREQQRDTKMYPNFLVSCSTFCGCGDGPHHYTVTYTGVETTTITKGDETKTYTALAFVLTLDKHAPETTDYGCTCEETDCLAVISDIDKMADSVILMFISKLLAFSSSSQTVWPHREELEIEDDDD